MPTNWETADILKSPMEICWQFDYEISREKLRNESRYNMMVSGPPRRCRGRSRR